MTVHWFRPGSFHFCLSRPLCKPGMAATSFSKLGQNPSSKKAFILRVKNKTLALQLMTCVCLGLEEVKPLLPSALRGGGVGGRGGQARGAQRTQSLRSGLWTGGEHWPGSSGRCLGLGISLNSFSTLVFAAFGPPAWNTCQSPVLALGLSLPVTSSDRQAFTGILSKPLLGVSRP